MKGAVIVNGIVLSLTLAPRPQVGHTHVDDVRDDDGDDISSILSIMMMSGGET